MVNMVKEQGNYWVANNFIWGLLLIPVTALSEIIRKDFYNKNDYPINKRKMTLYSVVLLVSYALWLILLFFLNPILSNIMGIENPNEISRIIKILVPFYFAPFTIFIPIFLTGANEGIPCTTCLEYCKLNTLFQVMIGNRPMILTLNLSVLITLLLYRAINCPKSCTLMKVSGLITGAILPAVMHQAYITILFFFNFT